MTQPHTHARAHARTHARTHAHTHVSVGQSTPSMMIISSYACYSVDYHHNQLALPNGRSFHIRTPAIIKMVLTDNRHSQQMHAPQKRLEAPYSFIIEAPYSFIIEAPYSFIIILSSLS